jgi:Flp pilus assembly protein TadG
MKSLKDESGQAVVLMLLSMTVLLGFVAFAVDVGLLLRAKRVVQTAADSAAIAGAAELSFGDAIAAAKTDAAQNGVTDGSGGATVAVTNISGPGGKTNYVQVIATQPQPTFFMKMFNFNSVPVSARAVAAAIPSPACVYTLLPNPFTVGKKGVHTPSPGVSVTGGASLTLPTCGIVDDATDTGALTVSGGGSISAKSIGVVGTDSILNGDIVTPTPITGITPVADPLSSLVTVPPASDYSTCQADPNISDSNAHTIGPSSPGGFVCYQGLTITHSPQITLNPGLYVIDGEGAANAYALSIAGGATFTGTGVTFYFVNSASFSITNGATLTLSAPTSGTYNGILFYQDSGDSVADSFVGGSSGILNGIFYLPAANLSLENGNSSTFTVDLVVGSLTMTGAATLKPYAPLSSTSPLSSPQLVE